MPPGIPHGIRRLPAALLLPALLAFPVAARADALQDGWTALKAGDARGTLLAWIPLAQSGDPRAIYAIGWAFNTGGGALLDRPTARRYYLKAANLGHPEAAYALGLMIRDGVGGRIDYTAAREWFLRAVTLAGQAGHRDAEYAAGLLYYKGLGVPRDIGQAMDWLERAARHDHPAAQFLLGMLHEKGWGIEPNRIEAFFWYSRAARHGQAAIDSFGSGMIVKDALARVAATMSTEDRRQADEKVRSPQGMMP